MWRISSLEDREEEVKIRGRGGRGEEFDDGEVLNLPADTRESRVESDRNESKCYELFRRVPSRSQVHGLVSSTEGFHLLCCPFARRAAVCCCEERDSGPHL